MVAWFYLAHTVNLERSVLDNLVTRFGGLQGALDASQDDLSGIPGLDEKGAEAISQAHWSLGDTSAKVRELLGRDFRIITWADSDYPQPLRQAEDPPPLFYQLGELKPQDNVAVAIIGSRDCSEVSAKRANEYAGYLVRKGLTIVSGYAPGVDINGHRGAIEAGGRTVIIPGCGVDCFDLEPLTPAGIRSFDDLTENAVLISEQPPEAEWSGSACRDRNRLVAAWAKALLVVEARLHSSTLDTVTKARRLQRPIFTQDFGDVTAPLSGNQMLREQGAGVIETSDDLQQIVTLITSNS